MTTIRYFIPEDGDNETHPNVFLAPKPRHPGTPPTLGQIKDAFPLPGTYHFRFKSPLYPGGDRDKGAMAVWMDLVNDMDLIPTWKNGVVAKVTRISMEDDDDDDDDFPVPNPVATPAANPRAPPSHQNSIASQGSSDHLDIFDGPSPGGTATPAAPASNAPPNLFDTPAAAPASGSSLLDMTDNYASTQAPSSAHADFLGMTAPAPAPQPGYPAAGNPNIYQPQQQQRPQQQQQQQHPQNAFNSYAAQQGPFGGLGTPWKP